MNAWPEDVIVQVVPPERVLMAMAVSRRIRSIMLGEFAGEGPGNGAAHVCLQIGAADPNPGRWGHALPMVRNVLARLACSTKHVEFVGWGEEGGEANRIERAALEILENPRRAQTLHSPVRRRDPSRARRMVFFAASARQKGVRSLRLAMPDPLRCEAFLADYLSASPLIEGLRVFDVQLVLGAQTPYTSFILANTCVYLMRFIEGRALQRSTGFFNGLRNIVLRADDRLPIFKERDEDELEELGNLCEVAGAVSHELEEIHFIWSDICLLRECVRALARGIRRAGDVQLAKLRLLRVTCTVWPYTPVHYPLVQLAHSLSRLARGLPNLVLDVTLTDRRALRPAAAEPAFDTFCCELLSTAGGEPEFLPPRVILRLNWPTAGLPRARALFEQKGSVLTFAPPLEA